MNILQYESKIWATADLLRGCGIKESEWPSFMMPFFALAMIESRLVRMFDDLKTEIGEDAFAQIKKDDLYDLIKDKGQGYNIFIFEKPNHYQIFVKTINPLTLTLMLTLKALIVKLEICWGLMLLKEKNF